MILSERRLNVGAAPRLLEARIAEPPGPPRGGAVVCHPHPEYGGDMHNPVVLAAVRACLDAGWAALRFNFGGTGASGGGFSGGTEEVRDVAGALAALRSELSPATPLAIVGYSFGAWVGTRAACDGDDVSRVIAVAPPLSFFDWTFVGDLHAPFAVIVGDRDQYCPPDRARALAIATGAEIITIPGADHFFAGRDDDVAAAIRQRI